MISPLTLAYGISTGGLLVGVVVAALLLNHRSATTHSTAFRALMIIPGFAAVAYATMALDIGTVMINGTPVTVPRYVDWAVTTPILVGFVGYTSGAPLTVDCRRCCCRSPDDTAWSGRNGGCRTVEMGAVRRLLTDASLAARCYLSGLPVVCC